MILATLATVIGLLAPAPPAIAADGCASTASATAAAPLASFKAGNWPSECWRPYNASSPFNRPIGKRPQLAAGSRAIIDRLSRPAPLNSFVAGDPTKDYGIPVYFSQPSDPLVTIHCLNANWGVCDIEGMQVRMPAAARPSGVWPLAGSNESWDSHLTIVDTQSGWEYDFWEVRSIAGGTIAARWGGRTRIDGDGLGSDAVASRFGSLAGTIRPEELAAGRIEHALVLNVPCTNGFVWPALKGALECSEAGMPSVNAPSVGQRLQLAVGPREIRRAGFPRWKRAILLALRRYGAYVSDTTGVRDQWSLRFASPATYTSFGHADRFARLARELEIKPEDYNGNGHGEFWFEVGAGVDWERLRVLDVCETRGTC